MLAILRSDALHAVDARAEPEDGACAGGLDLLLQVVAGVNGNVHGAAAVQGKGGKHCESRRHQAVKTAAFGSCAARRSHAAAVTAVKWNMVSRRKISMHRKGELQSVLMRRRDDKAGLTVAAAASCLRFPQKRRPVTPAPPSVARSSLQNLARAAGTK